MFGSKRIEANSYLQTRNNDAMFHQTKEYELNITPMTDAKHESEDGEENCFCQKKQCMIGLASIAIGIGGFVLAVLL